VEGASDRLVRQQPPLCLDVLADASVVRTFRSLRGAELGRVVRTTTRLWVTLASPPERFAST
jgi:hypothetical protein